jgi:hypothetical protein
MTTPAPPRKKIRHKWQEIGSGNQQCKTCGWFRVERHKPGQMLLRRVSSVSYEKRNPDGTVISIAQTPGNCRESPLEQLGLLDLSRFE